MLIIRQSTARIVTIGPILDTDGVAVTDAVVGDLKISKNGAAPVALNGSATLTHRHTGHYSLSLTATDTNTVGQAEVVLDDATNAMSTKELTIIEEAVYDALYAASATGLLPANVTQFGGTNGTFASGRPEVNTSHIAGSAVSTSAAQIGVNIVNAGGTAWATVLTNLVTSIWSATTRLLTAGTNIVLAKGTGVTGFNDLDAAGVRSAVGLASANLDTQIAALPTDADVNAQVDAALADYDAPTKAELDAAVAPLATATALSDVAADAAAAKAASEGAEDVLADLTEVSGADLRFTAVALEEAPTGGSVDPGAIAAAVLEESVAAHAGTAGSLAAVLTDIETDAAAAADPETLLDATSAVESGVTVRGSLRLMLAALAGKLSGAATTTVTIRNVGDSKNRITATVDESGNRTAVTTDAS